MTPRRAIDSQQDPTRQVVSLAPLTPHHHDGTVSVVHHRTRDATHQGPSQPPKAPATHNHETYTQLLAQRHYGPIGSLVHLEVGRHGGSPNASTLLTCSSRMLWL